MKCMCHWKNRLILQMAYPPVLVEAGGSSVLTQKQGKRSQVSPAEAWLWRQNPEALCVAEEVPKHPRPRSWAQLGWYFWDCNHTQQWDTVYDSSLRGNSATVRRKLWVHCLASENLNSWYKVRIIILSCVTNKEGKNPRKIKRCYQKLHLQNQNVEGWGEGEPKRGHMMMLCKGEKSRAAGRNGPTPRPHLGERLPANLRPSLAL